MAPRSDEGRGKLRKASVSRIRRYQPGISEWGNPPVYWYPKGSERREVKHLSTFRKRNQRDSVSSGERKRNRPNLEHLFV